MAERDVELEAAESERSDSRKLLIEYVGKGLAVALAADMVTGALAISALLLPSLLALLRNEAGQALGQVAGNLFLLAFGHMLMLFLGTATTGVQAEIGGVALVLVTRRMQRHGTATCMRQGLIGCIIAMVVTTSVIAWVESTMWPWFSRFLPNSLLLFAGQPHTLVRSWARCAVLFFPPTLLVGTISGCVIHHWLQRDVSPPCEKPMRRSL